MNQTPNYKLNQWVKSDQVRMEDFNADNAKIDAAIKAEANARAAAVQAVDNIVPRFRTGGYTGNGAEYRDIYLGFRPKAVWLVREDGQTFDGYSNSSCFGGLLLDGMPIVLTVNEQHETAAEVTASGFRVYYFSRQSCKAYLNAPNLKFHYVAFH